MKTWSFIALLAFFIYPLCAGATVEIAFLELRSPDGKLIQLERDFPYAHVAISYQGQWLNARPYYGVHLESKAELEKYATIGAIITLPEVADLKESDVEAFVGKEFDHDFSWSDEKVYCAELIAKILRLAPVPMKVDRKLWPKRFWNLDGQPGISPGEIYRHFQSLSYPVSHRK